MKRDIIVEVTRLDKAYKIYATPKQRLTEWLSAGKLKRHMPYRALEGVNFRIRRGEFIGIIGRNGAGKTTLLKAISGLIPPTSGEIACKGKILSLFNLGTSLNLQLSGRKNVKRTAVLLGFPYGYVEKYLAEIERFAELGNFFDLPVALYSTGMRMRLAFALFTYLESDILILDEVLAVGDIFFRQKCYERLNELIKNETTIIMVTHNMSTVKEYCDRVLVLEKGKVHFDGPPQKAIRKFAEIQGKGKAVQTLSEVDISQNPLALSAGGESHCSPSKNEAMQRPEKKRRYVELLDWALTDRAHRPCNQFFQGDQAYLFFEFQTAAPIGLPVAEIRISDQYGKLIHGKNSLHNGILEPKSLKKNAQFRLLNRIRLSIAQGHYVIGFQLFMVLRQDLPKADPNENLGDKLQPIWNEPKISRIEILPRKRHGLPASHKGICDLPGSWEIHTL
ncbi:MAG: ABC transporter ATP-binding protein [Desulfobacteraceae bacterium]|nr:ABC transporter ATP-binding protein [Desulfobacteraceae bacterium]MBC2753783.1 ABC transporter ATP-binding protein [Desulfobacteraceae bacterium]